MVALGVDELARWLREQHPVPVKYVAVGLDVGQQRDPTAVAVVELARERDGAPWRFLVRHMERLPLGTPYPGVVARVVAVVGNLGPIIVHEGITGPPRLVVDVTGVGRPIVDALRAELRPRAAQIVAASFTTGARLTPSGHAAWRATDLSVGKAYLVSRLQVLLQEGRLVFPARHPEAGALAEELRDYEIRVRPEDGHDTYGAFRTGAHDDLVTAVGLAALLDPAPNIMRTY